MFTVKLAKRLSKVQQGQLHASNKVCLGLFVASAVDDMVCVEKGKEDSFFLLQNLLFQ